MITRIEKNDAESVAHDLADILHACVHDGASVGFILPFSKEAALGYWQDNVFPALRSGVTDLFVARVEGRVVGPVQLISATMPNQPHRADVAKLLVHPDARRRGLGRTLMQALEARASDLGKTLLVLDTRSSDPSLVLYQGMGFQIAGEIPGYCRNPFENRCEPTTYMYKALEP